MEHNCPVCNKAGLPDYRAIATTCPQCNSDLKPYLFLNSISKRTNAKKTSWTLISVGVLAVLVAFLFFKSHSEKKAEPSEQSMVVSNLRDSVSNLQSKLKLISLKQKENETNQSETIIDYKVRRGDYPSKIAQFFYNDWKMYKKIESDNNLIQPYTLRVGQLLKIKITQ